jgi:hypothetical protein
LNNSSLHTIIALNRQLAYRASYIAFAPNLGDDNSPLANQLPGALVLPIIIRDREATWSIKDFVKKISQLRCLFQEDWVFMVADIPGAEQSAQTSYCNLKKGNSLSTRHGEIDKLQRLERLFKFYFHS